MTHALLGMAGAPALVLLCAVLFVEEAGFPLPMLPGDVLLAAGGVLIGTGRLSWLAFVPATSVAMIAGALIARAWSGAVGPAVLGGLARRLRCEGALGRATARLRRGGAPAVFVGRNLPGMRVYTNIAAGAAGVPWRPFAAGMTAAVLSWVVGFGLLGDLAGTSVLRALSRLEHGTARIAVIGAVVAVIAVGAVLTVTHLRRPAPGEELESLPASS